MNQTVLKTAQGKAAKRAKGDKMPSDSNLKLQEEFLIFFLLILGTKFFVQDFLEFEKATFSR